MLSIWFVWLMAWFGFVFGQGIFIHLVFLAWWWGASGLHFSTAVRTHYKSVAIFFLFHLVLCLPNITEGIVRCKRRQQQKNPLHFTPSLSHIHSFSTRRTSKEASWACATQKPLRRPLDTHDNFVQLFLLSLIDDQEPFDVIIIVWSTGCRQRR